MSRRPASSPAMPPSLPPARAAELLRGQRQKADELLQSMGSFTEAAADAWTETTGDLLIRGLGSDHRIVMRYYGAGIHLIYGRDPSPAATSAKFMNERLPFVDSAIEQLQMRADDEAGSNPAPTRPTPADTVFIVHGRDAAARETVARWLEGTLRPGLKVVILHEQPSSGRTLIEKIEHYGSPAAYVVVLMTGDDIGGPERTVGEDVEAVVARLQPRARQNVVLELGFFFGRLGRDRVAVLYEDGVELPSDLHGIVYIRLDEAGGWQSALARELGEAGLVH